MSQNHQELLEYQGGTINWPDLDAFQKRLSRDLNRDCAAPILHVFMTHFSQQKRGRKTKFEPIPNANDQRLT
jgi:hypothetical protein